MKLTILEFARSNAELKNILANKTPEIIEHLLKICLSPNNSARSHWMHEIYSFLNNVSILKSTKKYPKKEFIYEYTYASEKDKIFDMKYIKNSVNSIIDIESLDLGSVDYFLVQRDIDIICSEYFTWISEILSQDGSVPYSDIKNKIDRLIPKGD